MALNVEVQVVKRRPVAKNCRFCGKFMELWWTEAGALKGFDYQDYPLVPMFYCVQCNESDNVIIDPKDYDWILYEGTVDFEEAKKELSPQEYSFLLLDYRRMERRFKNRQYLAIPHLA